MFRSIWTAFSDLTVQSNGRIVTRGAFKVPTLRNQEFQGPYFHTGGDATLRQVVEFYARGGNFPATNVEHLDADMGAIPELDVGNLMLLTLNRPNQHPGPGGVFEPGAHRSPGGPAAGAV
jgi:hypothetical protein